MALLQHLVVYSGPGGSTSIDDSAGGPGRGPASLPWRNRDRDFPLLATYGDTTAQRAIRTVVNNGRLVLAGLRP